MRAPYLILLLALAIASAIPVAANTPSARLVVALRDFSLNEPLTGVELSIRLQLNGEYYEFDATTNEVGISVIDLPATPHSADLIGIELHAVNGSRLYGLNYSMPLIPVRVNNVLMESLRYTSHFDSSYNITTFSNLNIPLSVRVEGNLTTMQCTVWALPATFVNVSVLDPLTRRKAELEVLPGIMVEENEENYWELYLLPLEYPVLVRASTPLEDVREMRFWVSRNTSMLPWTYYVAKELIDDEISTVADYLQKLKAVDYPSEELEADLRALEAVAQQALILFKKGNHTSATGALISLLEGVKRLKARLEGLTQYSSLVMLTVLLLALGFSHFISLLLFERGRILQVFRLALLISVLVVLSLSSPTFRLASAGLLEALGVPPAALDILTLIACIEVLGFMTYGVFILLSVIVGPVRGFWLYLAVRYMKSKRFRTLLLLVTLTLVIASTLVISSVSASLVSVVGEGRGRGFSGLDIEVEVAKRPAGLSEVEIEWLKLLTDAEESLVLRTIPPRYVGVLISKVPGTSEPILLQAVALDMEFAKKYLDLDAHIYEGRLPLNGEYEVILPKQLSEYFELGSLIHIDFANFTEVETYPKKLFVAAEPLSETPFRVVGFFDPYSLNSTLDPEGRSLFEYPQTTALLILPQGPPSSKLIATRLWLFSSNSTALEKAVDLVLAAMPVRLHVLRGERVTTYERIIAISFRGLEALVLLVIAALMNSVVMLGHIEDRRRDIHMLAVLGADPRNLFYALMTEALVIGIVASFAGWLIAPLVDRAVTSLLSWVSGASVARMTVMSAESVLFASAMGLAVSLISTYIPSRRMKEVSLMGREERKVISPDEMRLAGGMAVYELPIRVSVFETELLYRYLKEILPRKDITGEEVYLDGTFAITFVILPPHMKGTHVTCRLRSVKKGDTILLNLEVPEEYRKYMYLSDVVYALETKLLNFSKWRESQFRYQILRREPRREILTLDDLLEKCSKVMARIREVELKLEKLESMKASISASLYSEYKSKYGKSLNSMIRELLTLSLKLEPFVGQLRREISRLRGELERLKVARELGEISRDEFEEKSSPVVRQLEEYEKKLKIIEDVDRFLLSRKR